VVIAADPLVGWLAQTVKNVALEHGDNARSSVSSGTNFAIYLSFE
jgi:hypothetical protein